VGILAVAVAVIGLAYLVIVRPKPDVRPEHRADVGSQS
jgi:hypothetical protein